MVGDDLKAQAEKTVQTQIIVGDDLKAQGGKTMAKIDTSTIPNFESLSDSDKLKALMELDVPEGFDAKKFVSKELFDRKASEAADYHRQLREKMTEDERKKAETEAAQKELSEKYEALLKETNIEKYKAKYLALGMDEALAKETAEAHVANNTDQIFKNIEKLNSIKEAKIKEELMRGTPKPAGSSGGSKSEDDSGVAYAKNLGAKRSGEKNLNEKLKEYF